MFQTTFAPMLDALAEQLSARQALADVAVFTGWVGEDGGLESIQFQSISTTESWSLIGNRRLEENYEARGFIWITRRGAGEPVIREVRDRAADILNEVIDQIQSDPTINGTVRVARVSGFDVEQGIDRDGRRTCRVDFIITVEAFLTA